MKFPPTIMTAKVGAIRMRYAVFGQGARALIILPGISLRSVMNNAGAIAGAYQQFCEQYTVYIFDRRDPMPADYSTEQMAADTVAVMRHIGIESADVFGASQGGMIAQCMAITYPAAVRKLALGGTLCRMNPTAIATISQWIRLTEEENVPAFASVP